MRRTKIVNVSFLVDEYLYVSMAAQKSKKSVSSFMRDSILNAANCPPRPKQVSKKATLALSALVRATERANKLGLSLEDVEPDYEEED